MKISHPTKSNISSREKKKLIGRKYQFSGHFLLLIVIITTLAGGLVALSSLPSYIKANYVIWTHPESINSILTENNLANIKLDIKFKNYQKIEHKRQQAVKRNLLISSDKDFVSGEISDMKESFDCKLRLKGDLSDHWASDKFSLRIRLKDNATLLGMSSFSLQRPVTRSNSSQFLFLESLRREGIIAVRYQFVNFTLNGKSMGVYAMEEHFSKELVESQKRREGVVVSFDESRFWKSPLYAQSNSQLGSSYQAADIQARNDKRTRKHPALSKQKVTALNLLRGFQEKKLQGDEVFSPEKLGRFLAICRIWNAEHAFVFTNINFYYDPITCRLEPIGFDGMPGSSTSPPHCYFSEGMIPDNWVNQALRSPKVAKAYIKFLDTFTQKSYIEKLKEDLSDEELRIRRILLKNLFWENSAEIWHSDGTLLKFDPWINLTDRVRGIRQELEEDIPAMSYARPTKDSSPALEIVVRNAISQPIEIIGFEQNGRHWTAKDILSIPTVATLDPTGSNVLMPLQHFGSSTFTGDHVFEIPDYFDKNSSHIDNQTDQDLNLITRILGMDERVIHFSIPVDPSRFKPEKLPFIKTALKAKARHLFLHEDGDSIYVKPGEHEVTEDLLIPPQRYLKIPAGTVLRFSKEAAFVCESPILALGTESAPITLTAAGATWPGMLIAHARGRSELRNVRFSKMAGIGNDANPEGMDRGGWTLTGGITFYQSPVDLSHCKISDVFSEDALNIVDSEFNMRDSIISEVTSDALDGDFVKGTITNCTFEKIGGDAIDLSGSKVTINDVRAFEVTDKAISAGEDTQIALSSCKFEDVGYGIASKDFSEVSGADIQISKARICALAAYQKKSLFGPSKISVKGLNVTETSKNFLIQKGSYVLVNGKTIEGINLNVNSLYQEKMPQR